MIHHANARHEGPEIRDIAFRKFGVFPRFPIHDVAPLSMLMDRFRHTAPPVGSAHL